MAEDFIIGVDQESKNHSNFQLNGYSSLPGHKADDEEGDDDCQADLIYRRPDDLIGVQQQPHDGDKELANGAVERDQMLGRSPVPAEISYRPKRQQDNYFVHAEGRAKIHVDHSKREASRHLNGHLQVQNDDGTAALEDKQACNLGFTNTFALGFRNESQDTILAQSQRANETMNGLGPKPSNVVEEPPHGVEASADELDGKQEQSKVNEADEQGAPEQQS